MNNTASTDVLDLVAARPPEQIVANLFTFALVSSPTYRWTDARRAITTGGHTYTPLRIKRGLVKLSRGLSVDSSEVEIVEGDTQVLNEIRSGFFNRAVYTSQRVFAADASHAWTLPVTRFVGRVNDIKAIGRTSATLACKSMVVDLDNDFPRDTVRVDCGYVLFDAGCTVPRAAHVTSATAGAGSTGNKLLSGLTAADGFYDQGVVKWTSGVMAGLCYMVRHYLGGVVYVAYPLLVAPAVGDTFEITPGCDKTMATCSAKFANLLNFPSTPFVPDPTVTY